MAILEFQLSQAGLSGTMPSIIYINTTNTIEEVLEVGFLNGIAKNRGDINDTDIALVTTKATPTSDPVSAWYQVVRSGVNWSLIQTAGNFSGPSTDEAIARFNGTLGTLQNSNVIISDSDAMSGVTELDVDNINIDGNAITSTDVNGDIAITPNGTGDLVLDGLNWPQADGTSGQVVVTDGAGQLSWSDVVNFGGPATDNAIARFDGTSGEIQNSGVIIDDSDAVTGVTSLTVDNLTFNGNTITADDTDGNITMVPDGTGNVDIFTPPASESSSININGTNYNTAFRVNDIGGASPAEMILHKHSTTLEPVLLSARTNSDTDSHAAVTNGMRLMSFIGAGWTGSQYSTFARISFSAAASGTISDSSAPGKINFLVAADGSISPTSIMDLTEDGMRLGAADARVESVLDEDDMASDSATALATQQSIKAYTDGAINNRLQGTTVGSLANNTAISLVVDNAFGVVLVNGRSSAFVDISGMVSYRSTTTPVTAVIAAANANFVSTTGALTGTTGSAGNFTVSVDSSGTLYFENRLGTSFSFTYTFFGS